MDKLHALQNEARNKEKNAAAAAAEIDRLQAELNNKQEQLKSVKEQFDSAQGKLDNTQDQLQVIVYNAIELEWAAGGGSRIERFAFKDLKLKNIVHSSLR